MLVIQKLGITYLLQIIVILFFILNKIIYVTYSCFIYVLPQNDNQILYLVVS